MPTYKHPCPHCGTYIERDVVACPACGRPDPFTPGRCPSCRATIEPGWIVCPKCGGSLVEAPDQTAATASGPVAALPTPPTGAPAQAATSGSAPADPPPVPAAPAVPAPSGAAVTPPAASSTTNCTGCGGPLPAGARFCRECGTPTG